jgi:hypothetical protein
MAEMHVVNESPTQITLEMDPAWKAETSNTFAESIKRARGCAVFVAIAFLLILAIVWYSRSNDALGSLPGSFWILSDLVFIVGGIFVLFEVYFELSHRKDADEATVTIDLDSQRAVRIEKLNSGRTTQTEIKLEQVTQILVVGDNAVHTLNVTLESQNHPSFNVNSDVFFDTQPMIDLAKKLGAFLNKPVVIKLTEAGEPISEETIQT